MKLVVRGTVPDASFVQATDYLTTDWEVSVIDPDLNAGAYAQALGEADASISMIWPEDMPPAPKLRLLQLPGAGQDGIVFHAVPPQTTVCNVYEHEIGIAEYLVGAMLQWLIRFPEMDQSLRQGRWAGGTFGGGGTNGELFGKTVGIIGYGHIGRELAQRLQPFGVTVIARTRSPKMADDGLDDVAGMDDLDGLFAAADFIVVCCPLSDETRGLIDRGAFHAMKETAVILNVARGPIIDEDALYEACRDRLIGGAVIDTWYHYPEAETPICHPTKHPLNQLDNVILTPHVSGWTEGLLPRRLRVIAENLDRVARGEPLLNVVRPPCDTAG